MPRPHCLQAITTKYLGPGNVRGSRIKATAGAGSVTLNRDHALNIDENHVRAAEELATKMKWYGCWIMGGTHDGHFVFVCLPLAYDTDLKGAAFRVEPK